MVGGGGADGNWLALYKLCVFLGMIEDVKAVVILSKMGKLLPYVCESTWGTVTSLVECSILQINVLPTHVLSFSIYL